MIALPLNIDYQDKVVVVTGAGGLICGAMARAFAQSGAKVAALDLNEDAVKALAEELRAEGFVCEGYKANVLDAEALEAVHEAVLRDLGPCDILVNGAGGNNPRATTDNEYQHEAKEGGKSFFDLDTAGVDFVFKLNFQGTLIPTQVFAKDMVSRKSGNILNISSMNAYTPLTKIPTLIYLDLANHRNVDAALCTAILENAPDLQYLRIDRTTAARELPKPDGLLFYGNAY
jgi:NAD(P)-dependent dehydrogenase (short-subunit alcohol dehydrogenase family)